MDIARQDKKDASAMMKVLEVFQHLGRTKTWWEMAEHDIIPGGLRNNQISW